MATKKKDEQTFSYIESDATQKAKTQMNTDVDALRNYGTFTPEQWGGSTQANQWWDKSLNMEKPVWDGAQYDQSVIDAANAIRNREKFSYDLNGDALYQQYKDKYIQQGKMAMMDTMGQAAALTGGYGNSYAATVGNQAYQAQLQNLNDIVPELYQLAYDRYQQEGQDLKDAYSLTKDWRDTKYGEWRDSMGDYYDESNMYWNRGTDIYNREYGEFTDRQNLNYKEWQSRYDKIADLAGLSTDAYNNERTFDYGSQQDVYNSNVDSQERAKSDVYAAIQSGVMPSDAMLQAAGLYESKPQLQAMANTYTKQINATVASKTKDIDYTGYDPIDDDKPVGIDETVPSEVPQNIVSKAGSFSTNDDLANYLDGLEASGVITAEQSDTLYAQNMTPDKVALSKRTWTLESNGGVNWLGGIDNNATVKDQYGKTYRLDKLVDALVAEGMTKDAAKTYVKNLQKQLGA